jgi:hypothetical protein
MCTVCSMVRVCDYCNSRFLLQKYLANTMMEASIKKIGNLVCEGNVN